MKVALVGCGRIESWSHLNILQSHPLVQIVAIADANQDALQKAKAKASQVKTIICNEDLLQLDDLDAVVICLPTHLHASAAISAFAAKKHVYLEKPLAISPEEVQQVFHAWRASKCLGMVGFNRRFHPLIRQAKELVQNQAIGKVTSVRIVQTSFSKSLPEWKKKRETGGGVLLDLASHQFDLLAFLLNTRMTEVMASVGSQRFEQDSAMLQIRTNHGPPAQVFISNSAAVENRIEIIGERGKIVTDRIASTVDVLPIKPASSRLQRSLEFWRDCSRKISRLREIVAPVSEPSYRLALDYFIDCIRESLAPSPDILDGCRNVAAVFAAEESAQTGVWKKPVPIDEWEVACAF
ncbi:MAG: Gfo/Idh/MocA family oxidoreductase [Planctomycetaceae bacterium]|nr:Gfo/Idh/MocA family oxidoreductase [Planctomycetaceae bacterium]